MNGSYRVIAVTVALSSVAAAEPTGRWFTGFGQGTTEYGIKNDSAGKDYLYIACSPDGATIDFTVAGKNPAGDSAVDVEVGRDKYQLHTDTYGRFTTDSHGSSDTFRALWDSLRRGSRADVRLSTGKTASFTLENTGRILPPKPCPTAYEL